MKNKIITNPILRGFLIAGMLIVAIFAFIGATKIIPKAFTSIGSAFSSISSTIFSPKETIILSLSNNSVSTGEQVDVSFEHKNKSNSGTYEFKFDCSNNDLSFTLIDGQKNIDLVCTATSTVASNTFKIIPHLKKENSFVDSYIYVTFNNDKGAREASGKTVLTVHNGTTKGTSSNQSETSVNKIESTKKETSTVVENARPVTNINVVRKSDLYIKTKDMGIIANGVFIQKASFGQYEAPVVRFNIANIGNTETGPWQFTAVLPTYPIQVFPSGIQPSLKPGEIIEYTLTLQNLANTGNNAVSINVDPTQSVSELSETNNFAVMTLVNSGSGYENRVYPYNNYNNSDDSDLMIRIIGRGYVDNDGDFVEASSISSNKTAAIKFEIENTGDEDSGRFKYSVYFPSYDDSTVTKTVSSIDAGERKRFIEEFEDPEEGTNEFEIRVDTDNDVSERREDNNYIEESLRVY
jgi:hypothetical protein